MILAAVLFAISALGGLVMAVMRLKGRELPPMGLALVHGGVGAAGLVALLVETLNGNVPAQARIALAVLVAAALGGFGLFSFHLRKKALPIPILLVHGVVAVIGFALLAMGIYSVNAGGT